MQKIKMLLNYDYKLYPYTTASYIEMAAKEIEGLEVYHANEISEDKVDFIFNIMPFDELVYSKKRTTFYWEIDCHMIRGTKDYFYSNCDLIFIAQPYFADYYPKDKTHLLPLGCDPNLHRLFPEEKIKYDIGFIGNDTYPDRRLLLEKLESHFKVLRTNSEPGLPYSKLLSQCALTFNRSMDHDVNMRFFECLSIGRALLTDYLPEQDFYAQEGKDYLAYYSTEDLMTKVKMLLKDKKRRDAIGYSGAMTARKKNTYKQRLISVIEHYKWIVSLS